MRLVRERTVGVGVADADEAVPAAGAAVVTAAAAAADVATDNQNCQDVSYALLLI